MYIRYNFYGVKRTLLLIMENQLFRLSGYTFAIHKHTARTTFNKRSDFTLLSLLF